MLVQTRGVARSSGVAFAQSLALEILFILGGYRAYKLVRVLIVGDDETAQRHGWALLNIERSLHLDIERPMQMAVLRWEWLTHFFAVYYVAMFIPFVSVALIFLFVREREIYRRVRRVLLISGGIGLVIFALFPVAPPRLLWGAGIVDVIHQQLPQFSYQQNGFANQYAAVPSFHFGWTALVAAALAQATGSRWLRGVLYLIPALMLVAIIVTGNHFWIDAVVGLAVVVAATRLAQWLEQMQRLMRQTIPI